MKRSGLILLVALAVLALAAIAPLVAYAEFGTNWTATYFNCYDLNCSSVATQTGINGINFNYGTGNPITGVSNDNFSIRFESVQQFQAGTYEFVISYDDGVRLFIDNVLVLDRFTPGGLRTDRVQQTLTAGPHALKIEYAELSAEAQIQFQYFLIAGGLGTGTPTLGFDALGTPIPVAGTPVANGASVVSVRGLAVRTGPYLGASQVTTAVAGTTYEVLARNRSEGSVTWYLLNVGGRQGWSSGRYLTFTGVDANALPVQGSVFDTIDNAPEVGVTGIPRSVMNVRVRPSERTDVIDQLAWGEEVAIIGRTLQGGINRWFQIRTSEGVVGWIAAPFVTVRGSLNAVPVR
jgi:uncharacterized protein YgiM (DUF1202 family)